MTYFNKCRTIEDVKETFRRLAKELHPDNGGNAEAFKAMMQEYTTAYNRLKDVHTSKDGGTYEKAGSTTQTAEQFADIINQIIHLDGIKIEIIGSWVWLTGNTYDHREAIKAAGFVWSKTKKAWYNAGEELKGKRRGQYSTLDKLKAHWGGSVEVKPKAQPKLDPVFT